MGKKTKLYIAYGSNLNVRQMAYRCPTAQVMGTSEIKDYELLFRGSRTSAVATVEPKEGSRVPVLLWKIREADEAALDRYEGYPCFYDKQMMEVELAGQKVTAMVYVMTPGHAFGIPSEGYTDTIRSGYRSSGLDEDVLDDALERAEELMLKEMSQSREDGQQSLFGMKGFPVL